MSNLLKGKTAVITGGGRGIGRAIAEIYASEGCNLVVISRTENELKDTVIGIREKYGTEAEYHVSDISDEHKIKLIMDSVLQRFNKIDILINAASILGPAGKFEEIETSEWKNTINTNINGLFYSIKTVLPHMKRENDGCIINFSGGGGLLPNPYFDAYSVCKTATVRLTENLSLELKNSNITICSIAPSGVNTRMFDDMMAAGVEKVGPEIWESFEKRKIKGGDPIENPQKLALFIAVNRSPLFNGRTISAKYDDWQNIEVHRKDLEQSDIYLMRRIMPKDRGLNW